MKIAFFVQYAHEAGTYFRWHNLAIALSKNHTVHIYAGDFNYKAKSRTEIRDGITYFITPSLITSRIFGNPSDPITAVYRWLKQPKQQYDVYHLFQPFLQAFLPWWGTLKHKSAVHFYDWDDLWTGGIFSKPTTLREKYTFWLVQLLERKLPDIADVTTVCSTYLAELLGSSSNCLIYNGFWPKENVSKSNSILLEKNNKYLYFGYVGRTCAELDWLYLLAQKSISQNKIQVVIAGPSKSQITASGILAFPNVQYIESLTPDEAFVLSSQLDLGLLPLEDTAFNQSRFPIKFFDYLVAGIPVYYSGVGELKLIGDKLTAAYDGGVTKEVWVDTLLYLVEHNKINYRSEMDMSNLYSLYTWSSIGQSLEKLYKRI
jgi:glycosyltransferase involved in cell wall biosynthesis